MGPGDRIGSFEILSPLSGEATGDAWRARDTSRGRDVVVRALAPELAANEEQRAGIERHAGLLATLDHANLARVYGLEESGGTRFLVSELIEGETLADRLARGRLPIEDSVKLALGIAQGLAAAHEKGVVHRNLNPSSVGITSDGDAKIFDFSLSRASASGPSDIDISNSPTLSVTRSATLPGASGYMSPEQARGEPAEAPADIWAFGCLLFQMLTGQPAFAGQTDSDVIASVLRTEPDWSQLPGGLHPRVRYLLERCLDKRLQSRCSDLAGVAAELRRALADPEGATAPGKSRWLPWVAALAAAVLLAFAGGWNVFSDPDPTVVRFPIAQATPGLDFQTLTPELGMSPDGSRAVFRGVDGTFYIRDRGDVGPRPVEITEETRTLWEATLSDDGQDLYYVDGPIVAPGAIGLGGQPLARVMGPFVSGNAGAEDPNAVTLRRVSADGGSTTLLTSWADNILDLTWAGSDRLLFADRTGAVLSVPANGGSPTPILENAGARYPQLLPGGDQVLYSSGSTFFLDLVRSGAGGPALQAFGVMGAGAAGEIVVQSSTDPEDRRVIWEGGTHARYVPETGHVVYVGTREPGLWAFPFDASRLEKMGDPVPLVDGVVVDFDVSASGALVYATVTGLTPAAARAAADGTRSTLGLFDASGNLVRMLRVNPGSYRNPRVSPDGTRVAYEFTNASGDHIWIYDLGTDLPRQLTREGTNSDPVWKDDRTLTFASRREEAWGMYSQSVGGTDAADLLVSATGDVVYRPQAWAPDGTLVFVEGTAPRTGRLMMVSPDSEISEIAPAEPGLYEFGAVLSPDGGVLVYIAGCEGFVGCARAAPFPPVPGSSFEVRSGVRWAAFSPDGSELFLGPAPGALEVRDAVTGTIGFEDPRRIIYGNPINPVANRGWDVGLDGETFVVGVVPADTSAAAAGGQAPTQPVSLSIDFFHNFFEVLEERVQ